MTSLDSFLDTFNYLTFGLPPSFVSQVSSPQTYPPYNIAKYEDRVEIHFAVAGFSSEDISVEVSNRYLTVAGSKNNSSQEEPDDLVAFTHKGIAARSFKREFLLGPEAGKITVELQNGLLKITVQYEEPETVKLPIIQT